MQALLLPAARSGNPSVGPPLSWAASPPSPLHRRLPRPSLSFNHSIADPAFPPPNSLSSRSLSSPKPYLSSFDPLRHRGTELASSISPTFTSSDESEKAKLAQVCHHSSCIFLVPEEIREILIWIPVSDALFARPNSKFSQNRTESFKFLKIALVFSAKKCGFLYELVLNLWTCLFNVHLK